MKPFQVPSIFEGINFLKERGCLSLRFHTNELTSEEMTEITNHHQAFGYLLFKPNKEFTDDEIPEDNAPSDETKTPSQRLRGVLYALHKRINTPEPFEMYYRKTLNKIIEHYKDKIEAVCPECGADKCNCKSRNRV